MFICTYIYIYTLYIYTYTYHDVSSVNSSYPPSCLYFRSKGQTQVRSVFRYVCKNSTPSNTHTHTHTHLHFHWPRLPGRSWTPGCLACLDFKSSGALKQNDLNLRPKSSKIHNCPTHGTNYSAQPQPASHTRNDHETVHSMVPF